MHLFVTCSYLCDSVSGYRFDMGLFVLRTKHIIHDTLDSILLVLFIKFQVNWMYTVQCQFRIMAVAGSIYQWCTDGTIWTENKEICDKMITFPPYVRNRPKQPFSTFIPSATKQVLSNAGYCTEITFSYSSSLLSQGIFTCTPSLLERMVQFNHLNCQLIQLLQIIFCLCKEQKLWLSCLVTGKGCGPRLQQNRYS